MRICRNNRELFKTVRPAVSVLERFFGLLGRKNIPESYVMYFPDCNSIHTFFMQTDIDVVMTDSGGRVVFYRENMKPWKTAVCLTAVNTLEMRAGAIRGLKLKLNDKLTIKRGR